MNILLIHCCVVLCLLCSITAESCKGPNQPFLLRKKTRCVELSSPRNVFRIRQKEIRYYHYFKDAYEFYFPEVKLECECTCNINNYGRCSSATVQKQNDCDRNQSERSTCSLFERTGVQMTCPNYYKVCCQVYFSIHNEHQQKYMAYQLQLWQHLTTRFKSQFNTKGPQKTTEWTIPNWVQRLIIDETVTLVLNMTKTIQSQHDLSNRWIYHEKQTNNFYTGVSINGKNGFQLDMLGWFRKKYNKNIMDRIPRETLQYNLKLYPQKCDGDDFAYVWQLDAVNYYRDDKFVSVPHGPLLSSEVDYEWLGSEKQFFQSRPALITKSNQLFPINVTMAIDTGITFSATVEKETPLTVTLSITDLPEGAYDVIVGYIEYKTVRSFVIVDSDPRPYSLTVELPSDIICNLTCVKHRLETTCVFLKNSSNSTRISQKDETRLEPMTSATTETKANGARDDFYKSLLKTPVGVVLLSVCCVLGVFLLCLIIVFLRRYRLEPGGKDHPLNSNDRKKSILRMDEKEQEPLTISHQK